MCEEREGGSPKRAEKLKITLKKEGGERSVPRQNIEGMKRSAIQPEPGGRVHDAHGIIGHDSDQEGSQGGVGVGELQAINTVQ